MPNGHPNFCQLCGSPVERMGIKYGCYQCAVIVDRRGGIRFPQNDISSKPTSPMVREASIPPYNIFILFKS